jgi:hypothetical protein
MEEQTMLVADETSTVFIGRWNRLISTTNWEKGRIICEWREAVEQAEGSADSATDEAWSQRVGSVTPQHVGRLRRVYERFGQCYEQYSGLFWSHFQAACEWPDAEMYLQGAVDNDWSISQMRDQRWEAMGGSPDQKPQESDIVATELDEGIASAEEKKVPDAIAESIQEVHDTNDLPSDEAEAASEPSDESVAMDSAPQMVAEEPAAPVRPFESLPPLPNDLNEAFELFKLAILAHKVTDWAEFSREDTLAVVESLRQLVLAPAG